jgi:hypothetical protein
MGFLRALLNFLFCTSSNDNTSYQTTSWNANHNLETAFEGNLPPKNWYGSLHSQAPSHHKCVSVLYPPSTHHGSTRSSTSTYSSSAGSSVISPSGSAFPSDYQLPYRASNTLPGRAQTGVSSAEKFQTYRDQGIKGRWTNQLYNAERLRNPPSAKPHLRDVMFGDSQESYGSRSSYGSQASYDSQWGQPRMSYLFQ